MAIGSTRMISPEAAVFLAGAVGIVTTGLVALAVELYEGWAGPYAWGDMMMGLGGAMLGVSAGAFFVGHPLGAFIVAAIMAGAVWAYLELRTRRR